MGFLGPKFRGFRSTLLCMLWCYMIWYDTTWYNMTGYDTRWSDMILDCVTWHNLVWCDMIHVELGCSCYMTEDPPSSGSQLVQCDLHGCWSLILKIWTYLLDVSLQIPFALAVTTSKNSSHAKIVWRGIIPRTFCYNDSDEENESTTQDKSC